MVRKYLITWFLEIFFILYVYCFLISGGAKSSDLSSHLRVHLLLQFMEHLEKLLYNAYEGCAVSMPMSPKVHKTQSTLCRNKFFSLCFYDIMQSTTFLINLSYKQEYLRVLRWIDHLNLIISCRRCGPFSGPTRAPAWSGFPECVPPSSR